jgi:alanyl-tRNA synthetase
MLTLNEIRNIYLKYFEKQKHLILPSSSLVPNDPTLMFTNSGMVQLKDYFAGLVAPPSKRITTCQKSVRAGGKHNDLENVGYTARHHTFFEMLGNFSIGDYFKKEAITWAWDLLLNGYNLPPEKLLVTVYHTDDEAIQLWKDIAKLPDDKIIKITTKDNFWEMGDTGPCGPCTEIFYDHGEEIKGGKPGDPDEDGDRYIEIWNNVFTQFERQPDGSLKDLKFKNIDTGMGLERIAAVLQGVHNNYDIDLFKKLIDNSKMLFGEGEIASHRVIADHLRSSSFLVADGVLPSNDGRGYVLRRIMRRAMRHIHQLGIKDVSMFKLVPCLVDAMGQAYPELKERESIIMETLEQEEVKFRQTLDRGLNLLEEEIEKYYKKISTTLPY